MCYSWEYTVKLRQQTPLIQFQQNQSGASLRATEVKPKLDRFFLWNQNPVKLLGAEDGAEERQALWEAAGELPADWTLPSVNPNADPALNYKMRILASNDDSKSHPLTYYEKGKNKKLGAYFGSLETSSFYQNITLTIICFIPELLEKIQDLLPQFFAVQNFGLRQNKGFGSFAVCVKNRKPADRKKLVCQYLKLLKCSEQPQFKLYTLKLQLSQAANDREILNLIADFNQRIKSDINFPRSNKSNPNQKAKVKRFASPLYFLPVESEQGKFSECLVLVSNRMLRRVQKALSEQKIWLKFTAKKSNRTAKIARKTKAMVDGFPKQVLNFPKESEFNLFDFFQHLVPTTYTQLFQGNLTYTIESVD